MENEKPYNHPRRRRALFVCIDPDCSTRGCLPRRNGRLGALTGVCTTELLLGDNFILQHKHMIFLHWVLHCIKTTEHEINTIFKMMLHSYHTSSWAFYSVGQGWTHPSRREHLFLSRRTATLTKGTNCKSEEEFINFVTSENSEQDPRDHIDRTDNDIKRWRSRLCEQRRRCVS